MAKKKIYAVRKGHKTGLFYTWDECKKAVHGYSGADQRHEAAFPPRRRWWRMWRSTTGNHHFSYLI